MQTSRTERKAGSHPSSIARRYGPPSPHSVHFRHGEKQRMTKHANKGRNTTNQFALMMLRRQRERGRARGGKRRGRGEMTGEGKDDGGEGRGEERGEGGRGQRQHSSSSGGGSS